MAWPTCPCCGARRLFEVVTVPEVHDDPRETQVFRSYECHDCKKILWSEEKIFCFDAPTKWLKSKFGSRAGQPPVTDRGERG